MNLWWSWIQHDWILPKKRHNAPKNLHWNTKTKCHGRKKTSTHFEYRKRCQSGLSLKYWNDFVLTVVYFINRTPIPILDHQAPLKYCSKPNYTHLKAFGFLAFAATLANGKHKFDSRSRKYVFTGYPISTMGTYC